MMSDCLSLDGTASRVSHLLREKEEKRAQERRRHLLHLIAAYLEEQGYIHSLETLFKEAQLSRDIQLCDNIDLETIIEEYTEYYYSKFNKYPKYCKKIDHIGTGNLTNSTGSKKEKNIKRHSKQEDNKMIDEVTTGKTKTPHKISTCPATNDFEVTVTPIFPNESDVRPSINRPSREKIQKSINSLYPSGSEWREIAESISMEIVLNDLNVHWNDIKGLEDCKLHLKEAIVYPIKFPSLFNGKFGSHKGVLLYGPPGTGKTMLAKAVATDCQCTFFNITSSSIVSKWRGDSEKYIRVLLDLAYHYAPTVIFIDEIDWIATQNEVSCSASSEPARRFRAELLARLDGLLSTENSNVILLATTNLPWNIDAALLRRLEKRIFVDLPNRDARTDILKYYFAQKFHDTVTFMELCDKTEGYSCADLKLLCKETWLLQFRNVWRSLENNSIRVNDINNDYIKSNDAVDAMLDSIKPTVEHRINNYIVWKQTLASFK